MSHPLRIRKPILAPQSQEPQVAISYFKTDTRDQFLKSTMRFLHNNNRVHVLNEEDLVLCYDDTDKVVFAICKLRTLDGDKIYREKHPYDQELYSGEYAKYNKYEIGVETVLIRPTTKEEILHLSDLPEDTNLLPPGQHTSFKRIQHPIHSWIKYAIGEAWLDR